MARAVQLVDLVARSDRGLSAHELSSLTGVHRSACYHLLYTLTQTGVLARDGSRYIMGARTTVLAAGARRHRSAGNELLYTAEQLMAATGETVVVAAWAEPGITVLGRTGASPIAQEISRGYSRWGHARASGKVLLALASDSARERFLAGHKLSARTAKTISDPRVFTRELDAVRETRVAVDDEEFLPGVSCLATPVQTTRGSVALCLVTPTPRFRADRTMLESELRRFASDFAPPPLSLAPTAAGSAARERAASATRGAGAPT